MATFRHINHTASGAMLIPTNLSVASNLMPVAHKIHVCMCVHTQHTYTYTQMIMQLAHTHNTGV